MRTAEAVPFRVFEHTADVGLEIEAPDLDGLFADAARGLFTIVRGASTVRPERAFAIDVQAGHLDGLLVRFLDEFIFLQDAEGVVFADVAETRVAEEGGTWRARSHATGEAFSHERHPGCLHVKATTRHEMRVVPPRSGGPAFARVILDV